MTPLEIEIMLYHYYTETPWDRPSPAAESDSLGLMRNGMLATRIDPGPDQGQYVITHKGTAYVLALQAVPMPVAAWRLPGSDTVIL